jgi:hypothetical protein
MYAIPAETATQGEPFQKENLPGPGKCATFFHATHFDTRKFVSPLWTVFGRLQTSTPWWCEAM